MEHIAIDLGGRESQVCRRSSDGTILEEARVATSLLDVYLKGRTKSRVVVETCAESFRVADWAKEHGHEVRVVPGTLVRSLGVGARGLKTDKRDARALSEASCRMDLPSVHVPSGQSREAKAMAGTRESLVGSRTQLINTVRGFLRGQGKSRSVKTGGPEHFGRKVRATFKESGKPLPGYVERQLKAIEELTQHIREADKELEALAKADPDCQRLMTVPGVGPVTAVRFRAAVDDAKRFPNAHALASYLGLVPGEHSSSDRQRRTSITKAGATRVRWALVQAAWASRRSRQRFDPMVRWSYEVEKRRGPRVAIVALARKLAGILYAILRDGTTYDPARSASRLNIEVSRQPVTP